MMASATMMGTIMTTMVNEGNDAWLWHVFRSDVQFLGPTQ